MLLQGKSSTPIDFTLMTATRHQPERLRTFLESIYCTASEPSRIEVVLVIDDDDDSYKDFYFPFLKLRWISGPPGRTMGSINHAGYQVANGRIIFGLNDDIIAKTPDWDKTILEIVETYADGIVFVHVNDGIFGRQLCTFPCFPRTVYELFERSGGLSIHGYRRYAIDDHIHDIFNLLAYLGHVRTIYLEDVLFEHKNVVIGANNEATYQPNPEIHALDTVLFESLLEYRKQLALKLVDHIVEFRRQNISQIEREKMAVAPHPYSLRQPQYSRIRRTSTSLSSETTRVTVGIVSANLQSDLTQKCIDHVKRYTENYDLVVLDNNRGPNFNHAREMNRMIEDCRNEFIVLLDDDVFVEPDWLDGLLRCVDSRTALVTPMHKDRDGKFSYGGAVMSPAMNGDHSHAFYTGEAVIPTQTICSAIMLLDLRKIGHLRVNEAYSKYFLDIDFGMLVWEAGWRAVCARDVMVTHLGGGTLPQGSDAAMALFEPQRRTFCRLWVETGRHQALMRGPWAADPLIRRQIESPQQLAALLEFDPHGQRSEFFDAVRELYDWAAPYPAIRDWMANSVWQAAGDRRPNLDNPDLWPLAFLLGQEPHLVAVEWNFHGYVILLYRGLFYGAPQGVMISPHGIEDNSIVGLVSAESLDGLLARITDEASTRDGTGARSPSALPSASSEIRSDVPRQTEGSFGGAAEMREPLQELVSSITAAIPADLLDEKAAIGELEELLVYDWSCSRDEFFHRARQLYSRALRHPKLYGALAARVREVASGVRPHFDHPRLWPLAFLLGLHEEFITVGAVHQGLEVFMHRGEFYAVPAGTKIGPDVVDNATISATTLDELHEKMLPQSVL